MLPRNRVGASCNGNDVAAVQAERGPVRRLLAVDWRVRASISLQHGTQHDGKRMERCRYET